jgi:coproporphyrinogen III oxidase
MEKEIIESRFRKLQLHICNELEKIDGFGKFQEDAWKRSEGGGGYTRTITNGNILEKGGVAFSAVHGDVSDAMRRQLGLEGESFFATGVSIVLHPKHPRHPIIHMNVRYFELNSGKYWFGGGIDLTPHYVNQEAAVLFHQGLKQKCDAFHTDFYSKFKPWADEYFSLPHRKETRGIGGIFFDHQDENCGISKEKLFQFCVELGELFPILYKQQIDFKVVSEPTVREKQWQLTRRGRYVEFNLLHDRGTKFGIYSGGRTESILMSMPPLAEWTYNLQLEKDSEEQQTLDYLSSFHDWLK